MKNLGALIKYQRKSQKLTLQELAKGICSVSYLSKIENGNTKCSEEVTELLLERLGIHPGTMINETEENNKKTVLQRWYGTILDQALQAASIQYKQLHEGLGQINNLELNILFQLFTLRYYLLIKDYQKIESSLQSLNSIYSTFTNMHKYFYHKFVGLYEYTYGKQTKAKDSYLIALELFRDEYLDEQLIEKEKADLYFVIALNEYRLFNYSLCMYYTQQAIQFFNEQFQYKRCIDCYIILGLTYKQISQFDQAKKQFNLAINAANELEDKSVKGMAYQNLGNLYYKKGDFKEALTNYILSYKCKKNASTKAKLFSVISIIKVYDHLKETSNIIKWTRTGIDLLDETNDPDYISMHYILFVYKYKTENNLQQMQRMLIDYALPHFIEKEQFQYSYEFATLLADLLGSKQKYKQAYHYSIIANQSLMKLAKVNN
ncbi:helix-turn-helix domain-containing protein [Aquibacillus kalidii]|uniref:helix-turn-helix domain-containing protein n=1 Tax=Aquibacillus kalidii TaxID=2762597 RepID=UPI001644C737|nr:helix-turn-helix domain-containing protein [Aquibacillus kalidii]